MSSEGTVPQPMLREQLRPQHQHQHQHQYQHQHQHNKHQHLHWQHQVKSPIGLINNQHQHQHPPAGAWRCSACGNVNYSHRKLCNRRFCSHPRGQTCAIDTGAAVTQTQLPLPPQQKQPQPQKLPITGGLGDRARRIGGGSGGGGGFRGIQSPPRQYGSKFAEDSAFNRNENGSSWADMDGEMNFDSDLTFSDSAPNRGGGGSGDGGGDGGTRASPQPQPQPQHQGSVGVGQASPSWVDEQQMQQQGYNSMQHQQHQLHHSADVQQSDYIHGRGLGLAPPEVVQASEAAVQAVTQAPPDGDRGSGDDNGGGGCNDGGSDEKDGVWEDINKIQSNEMAVARQRALDRHQREQGDEDHQKNAAKVKLAALEKRLRPKSGPTCSSPERSTGRCAVGKSSPASSQQQQQQQQQRLPGAHQRPGKQVIQMQSPHAAAANGQYSAGSCFGGQRADLSGKEQRVAPNAWSGAFPIPSHCAGGAGGPGGPTLYSGRQQSTPPLQENLQEQGQLLAVQHQQQHQLSPRQPMTAKVSAKQPSISFCTRCGVGAASGAAKFCHACGQPHVVKAARVAVASPSSSSSSPTTTRASASASSSPSSFVGDRVRIILVPVSCAGAIIGHGGTDISSIKDDSGCKVLILGKEVLEWQGAGVRELAMIGSSKQVSKAKALCDAILTKKGLPNLSDFMLPAAVIAARVATRKRAAKKTTEARATRNRAERNMFRLINKLVDVLHHTPNNTSTVENYQRRVYAAEVEFENSIFAERQIEKGKGLSRVHIAKRVSELKARYVEAAKKRMLSGQKKGKDKAKRENPVATLNDAAEVSVMRSQQFISTSAAETSAVQYASDSSSDDEWEASASLLDRNSAFVSSGYAPSDTVMSYQIVNSSAKVEITKQSGAAAISDIADANGDATAHVVREIEVLMCIVCMDQERTMLCLPCRHLQLCEDCSSECKNCPSCRAEVQQYLKVFT